MKGALASEEKQRTIFHYFHMIYFPSLLLYVYTFRYLHLRYNLGSGEINIKYNSTKVSDGLWHRVRALRYAIDTPYDFISCLTNQSIKFCHIFQQKLTGWHAEGWRRQTDNEEIAGQTSSIKHRHRALCGWVHWKPEERKINFYYFEKF